MYKLGLNNWFNRMEKTRESDWTKEEECALINEIETAGETLRGSGNSADINKKKKQLWKTITAKVNAVYGNNRGVEDMRRKWNNLKVTAKSKVDACRIGEGRTGQGNDPVSIIEDEEMLIIAADRSISNSDSVRENFENTPTISGISGAVDLFQAPSCSIVSEGSAVNSCDTQNIPEVLTIIESPEIEIRTQGSRKRKRSACDTSLAADPPKLTTTDIIHLQKEVPHRQLFVFSAQLKLIEEQREYYQLKQKKLDNS